MVRCRCWGRRNTKHNMLEAYALHLNALISFLQQPCLTSSSASQQPRWLSTSLAWACSHRPSWRTSLAPSAGCLPEPSCKHTATHRIENMYHSLIYHPSCLFYLCISTGRKGREISLCTYLDLSAKVPLDLLLPVPVELLLPLLAFQVADGHKPLTRCLHICRDPRPRGIGTKLLSKKGKNISLANCISSYKNWTYSYLNTWPGRKHIASISRVEKTKKLERHHTASSYASGECAG